MINESKFTMICFTGQPMTENEEVVCYTCSNHNDLLTLRGTAWFDKHVGGGKYVHLKCLSEQRKAELREDGIIL